MGWGYFFTLLGLVVTLATACQSSHVQRRPSSMSAQGTQANALLRNSHELVNAFAYASEPRQMLFQHFLESVETSDFSAPGRWVLLQRQFIFLQLLNRQLDADPFVSQTTYAAQDYILKIEKVLSSHIDSTITVEKLETIDRKVVLGFLEDQANRVLKSLDLAEVQISNPEKTFIRQTLDRVIRLVHEHESSDATMFRSLASESRVSLLNSKDWGHFQKLALTAVPVADQGDIFGGSQAVQNAVYMQYGIQFIATILNPRNRWIGKPMVQ